MPSSDIITIAQLLRLVGTAEAPMILDVRTEEDFAKDPRSLPGAIRRDFRTVASWAGDFAGRHLAIVRGADTARLDLAPEAAGLLAASRGLSRMHRDDLAQLDAAMGLYDAFYRWARDAPGETHNWPAPGGRA